MEFISTEGRLWSETCRLEGRKRGDLGAEELIALLLMTSAGGLRSSLKKDGTENWVNLIIQESAAEFRDSPSR